METIVDQLKTVNSKSFLEEVKNPENINNLILKNFNNETNWDEISKFTQLNKIQLENCLIDNNIFFKAIAKIQSLTTLKYDYDCIIKKSDIIIIASPHKAYKKLKIKKNKVLVDIWGLFEKKR